LQEKEMRQREKGKCSALFFTIERDRQWVMNDGFTAFRGSGPASGARGRRTLRVHRIEGLKPAGVC
jgi:hypothetical protein